MNVYKIVIGGFEDIGCTLSDIVETIAACAGEIGIDGFTVSEGIGWHCRWGSEYVLILETATTAEPAQRFAAILCKLGAQTCAYVTVNGSAAALWYPDGRTEVIHPIDSDAAEFLSTVRTAPERILRRAAGAALSALETPGDLNETEKGYVIEDLDIALHGSPHGRTSDRDNSLPRKPAVY